MALLRREDLLDGLGELIKRLRSQGITGGVQIIGGAALALRYFDRASTADVDARFQMTADITEVVATIGAERGWGADWLNDAGAKFIPDYGRSVEWETVFSRQGLEIQVASADALLAMKLRANRPGRDNNDIAELMAICGVRSLDEADALYEAFYPGDVLDPRAERMVNRIIESGLPSPAPPPEGPQLDV